MKPPRTPQHSRFFARADNGVRKMGEMSFEDITETLAGESGFVNIFDLIKTAKHRSGRLIDFIEFYDSH